MPPSEEELDPGLFTRSLKNPWISVPFALLSGFGAAATPATRRATAGVHGVLPLILAGEKAAYEQEKEKRLSEALKGATEPTTVTKPLFDPAAESLLGAGLSEEVAGERRMSDMSVAPFKSPTYTATEQQLLTPAQRRLFRAIGAIDPKTAISIAAQNIFKPPRVPIAVSPRPGSFSALMDPGTGKEIGRVEGRPASAFDKLPTPTTMHYTPESIRAWRATITPENPEGNTDVLVPREDPLKASQIERNRAIAERARKERSTKSGSVAYQEFLQFGGDPQDEEGYLDFLNRRKEGMEKRVPVRRGDVKEARQALAGVAESEAFKTADDEQKKRWLEESANGFGYTIIGDPVSKGYLFGIGKGSFDSSKIGLAPIEAKERLKASGKTPAASPRAPVFQPPRTGKPRTLEEFQTLRKR